MGKVDAEAEFVVRILAAAGDVLGDGQAAGVALVGDGDGALVHAIRVRDGVLARAGDDEAFARVAVFGFRDVVLRAARQAGELDIPAVLDGECIARIRRPFILKRAFRVVQRPFAHEGHTLRRLQRHGDLKLRPHAVGFRARALDFLGDGQVAQVARVGDGFLRHDAACDVAFHDAACARRVAVRHRHILGHGVVRARRDAVDDERLVALEGEFRFAIRVHRHGGIRLAIECRRVGAFEDHVIVALEQEAEREFVLLAVGVAGQSLGHAQVADVHGVGHGDELHAVRDAALRGLDLGFIAVGRVVILGDGVLRVLRQVAQRHALAILEDEAVAFLHVAGARALALALRPRAGERHARRRGQIHRDGKLGQRVGRILAVAFHFFGHGEAADVALVGEGRGLDRIIVDGAGLRDVGSGLLVAVGHRHILGHGVGRALGDALDGEGLAVRQLDEAGRLAVLDLQGARLGGRALVGGGGEGGLVVAIDIRAVLVLLEGEREVKCAVLFPAGAGDGLANDQIAGIADVGVGHLACLGRGDRVGHQEAGVVVGDIHAVDLRDIAFLAVVLLGHGVGRVFQQAGEGDGLAAFEGEGLCPRLAGDIAGDRRAVLLARVAASELGLHGLDSRGREGDGDVKRLVRIRVVAHDGLADGQLAGLAGVGEDHFGLVVLRDLTRGVCGSCGHVAFRAVVVLGHGVGRAHRDAGNDDGLVSHQLEGRLVAGEGVLVRLAIADLRRIALRQRDAGGGREGQLEVEGLCRAAGIIAVHGLFDRQRADIVGVRDGDCVLVALPDRLRRIRVLDHGRLEVGGVVGLGDGVLRAHGQAGEEDVFAIREFDGDGRRGVAGSALARLRHVVGVVDLPDAGDVVLVFFEGDGDFVVGHAGGGVGLDFLSHLEVAHGAVVEVKAAERVVRALKLRVFHGCARRDFAFAIVGECDGDGVDGSIVDETIRGIALLFGQLVGVGDGGSLALQVRIEIIFEVEGEVARRLNLHYALAGEGGVVFRGQREGVLPCRALPRNAVEELLARDGQGAFRGIGVGDGHGVLDRAGHALAGVGFEHEVVGVLLFIEAGHFDVRFPAYDAVDAGVVVAAIGVVLGNHVVGVGIEEFVARRELLAGFDGRNIVFAGHGDIFIRIVRAVHIELDAGNGLAVGGVLVDGQVAHADEADIVGVVHAVFAAARRDVELDGLAGEGKVAVGVRALFDRGLAGRGDAVASRDRDRELVGRAGAAHEAGVVDIAAGEVLCIAALRRGGVEITEVVLALCIRRGRGGLRLTRNILHVGVEGEDGLAAGHLGLAFILDAVHVLVDPDAVAESDGIRHDGDLGVRAGQRGGRTFVVHAGGGVDRQLIVVVIVRGRGRGGGVGQRYRRALLQLLDHGEEGVGALGARVRADAFVERGRVLGRTIPRVVDGARAGNSARERRAPRAAAIAIVGKHIEDAQVRNSSTAVVGDGHAVVDGRALLGDQQRFVAVPVHAIDADQLVDGDAGRAGHGVRGLGSEGHAAAALGEGGEALRHGNARQRAALIREGGAMLVVHALGHGMLVEDIGRVRKGRAVDERRRGDVGENGEGQRIALGKLARGGDPDILTSLLRAGDLERCGIRLSLDAAFHRGEAGGQDVREDGVFHSFLGHTGEGDGVEEALAGGDGLALDLLAQSVLHLRGLLDGDLRQSRLVLDGGAGGGGIFLRPGRGGIGSAHGAKVVGHFDGGGVADRLDRDGALVIIRLTGLDVEDDGVGLEAGVEGGFFIAVAVNDLDAIAGVRCERDGLFAGDGVLGVRAPAAVRALGAEVGVDGGIGGRIVVSGLLVVRRADDDALDIPLDAGHVLAVRVLEGEGIILEGRVFQRQHGVGGEAAEGEPDGLICIAQQVAFAEVYRGLLDIDIEVLRVGQVGKHHHGDAAIVADLDLLLRAPNLVLGVRGVEVAGRLLGLGDGVGTLGYIFDVVEGVGNAVLFVVVALGIIASELPIGGRAVAVGLTGHRAYSLKDRVLGQGGVVEIVVFEDGDLAKRGIVGVEVNVRVRGHAEVAVRTGGDLLRGRGGIGDVVELQRAFLKAVGRHGLLDGVVLAIRELREVVEADGAGAVRAGGLALGRKVSVLRAVCVHAVERELRAIERAAAFRHAVGLVVLGQGDDDALLVDDGVRKGRALACRERDSGVRRGRVACGGLGLLHVEGIVRHGAVDDAVGQLDVCESDRAVRGGSSLRRVLDAGDPLLGLLVPVELRTAHLIIEGKFCARQRGRGGGVALRAFLGEGEARDVADVGEVDRGGLAGVDFHHGGGAVVAAQPGEGFRVLRQGVLGVPVAGRGLLDVVGAGIEREGRVIVGDADALVRAGDGSHARAGDGEGADLAALGAILVRVDIEGNGLGFEAGHALIRLGDVEVALAGVDDGDFGAAGGVALAHRRAEVFRGDFDDHVFRQHVILVGVAFHLVQPVPAGDEAVGAVENDHAVFARGERIFGDGHAGQGLHIAFDRTGLRRVGSVVVILGESLEVQLELHAFQGLFLIIRLGEREAALAGVFEGEGLLRIGRGDGEGGIVVDDGEVVLLRLAQLLAADMRLRDGVGAGGEVEFRLAVVAGGDGIDGRLFKLAFVVHQPDLDGRAVVVDLEGGGDGGALAVYLGQRDLAVEDVVEFGDDVFALFRFRIVVAGRCGELAGAIRRALVACGHFGLLVEVERLRIDDEGHAAIYGDTRLAAGFAIGSVKGTVVVDVLVDGDLSAIQGPAGIFSRVRGLGGIAVLQQRDGDAIADDVYELAVLLREIPHGLVGRLAFAEVVFGDGVVGAVGREGKGIARLLGRGVIGIPDLDHLESRRIFKDGLAILGVYGRDVICTKLVVQAAHLDGFGNAAARVVASAGNVHAGRECGKTPGRTVAAENVEREGGVGQLLILACVALLVHILIARDLVELHLHIADGVARAMQRVIFHCGGHTVLQRAGNVARPDGGGKARGRFDFDKEVVVRRARFVARGQIAGHDAAGASALGGADAGFVDVFADEIAVQGIDPLILAVRRTRTDASAAKVGGRGAAEDELGAVEGDVLVVLIHPDLIAVFVEHRSAVRIELLFFLDVVLVEGELDVLFDVGERLRAGVIEHFVTIEVDGNAVVLLQRSFGSLANDVVNADAELSAILGNEAVCVGKLKDIVGLGAVETGEGSLTVCSGLLRSRTDLLEGGAVLAHLKDGELGVCQLVGVIGTRVGILIPLFIVFLGDGDGGNRVVREGDAIAIGAVGLPVQRDAQLRGLVEQVARRGLGLRDGIGNLGRAVVDRQAGDGERTVGVGASGVLIGIDAVLHLEAKVRQESLGIV